MPKLVGFKTIREFAFATGFIIALTGCVGTGTTISNDEMLNKVEGLKDNEVLVSRPGSQVVIDGLTSNISEPQLVTWPCVGKGATFVTCTKGLVDTRSCAITVKHKGGIYCSKPC